MSTNERLIGEVCRHSQGIKLSGILEISCSLDNLYFVLSAYNEVTITIILAA